MSDIEDPLNIAAARETRDLMSGNFSLSPIEIFKRAESVRRGLAHFRRYLRCKNGPGGLNVEEFLRYGLTRENGPDANRFVGSAAQQKMHAACNDKSWFAVTKNKLLWQTIMTGGGFRVPEVLAIYDTKGRGSGAPVLENAKDLSAFLVAHKDFPIFCKPVTGVYSIGAMRIDGVENGNVRINSRWEKPVGEVANYFEQVGKKGYVLQSMLRPDPKMKKIAPDAISTMRVMVLLNEGDVKIFRVVLKIPGKAQVADNFWRTGALLCALDRDNGTITRAVVSGEKAQLAKEIENVNSGHLKGWQVPHYNEALKMCKEAAKIFPGIRSQSWDVALSDRGPVLLELNFGGDLGLLQMAHDEGALDGVYGEHLRRCGYHDC